MCCLCMTLNLMSSSQLCDQILFFLKERSVSLGMYDICGDVVGTLIKIHYTIHFPQRENTLGTMVNSNTEIIYR